MRLRPHARFLVVLLAVAIPACGGLLFGPDQGLQSLPGKKRVLFIGNSHTILNNVPSMLEVLARLMGDTALRVGSVSFPGISLEDHYGAGNARRVLRDAKWEYVVLQQGPSSAPENQLHLRTWSLAWNPLIRADNAEPILYQVWPLAIERFNADAVLTAYHNAAFAVEGYLAPAGDAFTVALDEDPDIGVYAGDGQHASVRGSYLAALVILGRINGIHPESLDAVIPGGTLAETDSVIRQLQRAAATALGRNPAKPTAERIN